MIDVHFNGNQLKIESETVLSDLLLRQNYSDNFFAVAVNKQFISKNKYTQIVLNSNDVIDIIMPMQGG